MVTLLQEMKQKNVALGMATLCIGGGQGMAMVVERS
jgi:acetyl-CoA C-acetyltransferase